MARAGTRALKNITKEPPVNVRALCIVGLLCAGGAYGADTTPLRTAPDAAYPNNVYFGDLHVHTRRHELRPEERRLGGLRGRGETVQIERAHQSMTVQSGRHRHGIDPTPSVQ